MKYLAQRILVTTAILLAAFVLCTVALTIKPGLKVDYEFIQEEAITAVPT